MRPLVLRGDIEEVGGAGQGPSGRGLPWVGVLPGSEPPALLEATCCSPVGRLSLLTAPSPLLGAPTQLLALPPPSLLLPGSYLRVCRVPHDSHRQPPGDTQLDTCFPVSDCGAPGWLHHLWGHSYHRDGVCVVGAVPHPWVEPGLSSDG